MKFGIRDTAEMTLFNKETGEEILKCNSIINTIDHFHSEKEYKYKVEMTLSNGKIITYGTDNIKFTEDGKKLITDKYDFDIE